MLEDKMNQILKTVEKARSDPSANPRDYYLSHMHELAEAQYLPAIGFFVSCLDDDRSDWREYSIEALGFHYDLRPYKDIVKKISYMLLTDPDDAVRMVAASVLGIQSEWPSNALIQSLQSDKDPFVRNVSFHALLNLAGVPFAQQREIMEKVEAEEITATLEELKRIISNKGLNLKIPSSE